MNLKDKVKSLTLRMDKASSKEEVDALLKEISILRAETLHSDMQRPTKGKYEAIDSLDALVRFAPRQGKV